MGAVTSVQRCKRVQSLHGVALGRLHDFLVPMGFDREAEDKQRDPADDHVADDEG